MVLFLDRRSGRYTVLRFDDGPRRLDYGRPRAAYGEAMAAVLKALGRAGRPLTAPQVRRRLRGRFRPVTVAVALRRLAAKGWLAVEKGDGRPKYALPA